VVFTDGFSFEMAFMRLSLTLALVAGRRQLRLAQCLGVSWESGFGAIH